MPDLIDRKEAIKVISNDGLDVKCFCVIGRGQENRELAKTINDYVDLVLETAKRKILSLPKADTERHAHWDVIAGIKDKKGVPVKNYYRCSNCERFALAGIGTTYCARCGCKMDEVVGNE